MASAFYVADVPRGAVLYGDSLGELAEPRAGRGVDACLLTAATSLFRRIFLEQHPDALPNADLSFVVGLRRIHFRLRDAAPDDSSFAGATRSRTSDPACTALKDVVAGANGGSPKRSSPEGIGRSPAFRR